MHVPVLMNEVLEFLDIREEGVYIDGTMGSGGHSEAILERLGANGLLLAIDRDGDACERCGRKLKRFGNRCIRVRGNYADIKEIAENAGIGKVDGILLDLGVSSDQIDAAERGFSFMRDGPLDMRMDQSSTVTAADVVNDMSENDLKMILWKYGEERSAKRVAAAIVKRRADSSFKTTGDLAEVISEAKGGRRGRKHPATQSFQAIRMEVNRELDGVEQGLSGGVDLLRSGGRMAVITFHSIEDRLVKRCFREHEGCWKSLDAGGERWEGALPPMRRITRKAVKPTAEECESNPRARSSKLRVAERLLSPYKRGKY